MPSTHVVVALQKTHKGNAKARWCLRDAVCMQEQEQRARMEYRRHLNHYFRARPLPDMTRRFAVNHDLAPPATKPQPFHLSEGNMVHVPAHLVGAPR